MFLYFDALDGDAGGMTRQSLVQAVRRFKFFPSASELVEFFAEIQPDRKQPVAGNAENGTSRARINNLAHLAVRDWQLPAGLGFWGGKAAYSWFLSKACDAVMRGGISGVFRAIPGGGCRHELTTTIGQPQPPADLLAAWLDEVEARGRYLEAPGCR